MTDTTDQGELQEQEPAQVRPFAAVLQDLNHGTVADDASRLMQELVAAVRKHGKKGGLTLKLGVAPMKGNERALLISASVSTSLPQAEPVVAPFFADKDHNLVRDDPSQLALPLREVPTTPNRTIELRKANTK